MGQASDKYYTIIERIKDDRFNIDLMEQYCLSIQIGLRDCQIAVFDVVKNQCLLAEDYTFHEVSNISDLIECLTIIYDDHHVLQAQFWGNIKVSINNQIFVLVPENQFEEIEISQYLNFATEANHDEHEYFYHHLPTIKAYFLNAASRKITNFFRSKYPTVNIQFLHQGISLIAGFLKFSYLNKQTSFFVYAGKDYVNIYVSEKEKVLFYNRFNLSSANELTKYVLMVFKTLNLSPHKIPVILWGNIQKNTSEYKQLYQHVINLNFGKRPGYITFGYMFDQADDHKYFDLYNTHLL